MMENIKDVGKERYLFVGREWYSYDTTSPPLGQGAMGTVYLGRSCRQPGLKVAIKRVDLRYANIPDIRHRAHLEGSLMFRHRNLVEMVGYCENDPDKGDLYIISHLVQGINLDIHVQQNLRNLPDSYQRICRSFFPVLDALEYLHSNHIVHLDVKPSNIMIEEGRNVRLMDLGIASVSQTGSQSGNLVGTPRYAAPEQAQKDGQINASTDIYEAAVTLYELLAGENPFDAPTVADMMQLHRTKNLPYKKGIPKKLIDVLRVATSPDQNKRYQSVAFFRDALKTALNNSQRHTSRFLPIFFVFIFIIVFIVLVIIILNGTN